MPSTVIAHIDYHAERERLTVTFVTGRIYEYLDVPAGIASSFRSAPSKGAFFNRSIRDFYSFREVTMGLASRSA